MQTIKMDFQSQSTPPVVPVMQSDSQSRFIGITLYNGGVPYEAPEGASYTVQYRGPGANNMGWYDTIQLSSGTRKAVIAEDAAAKFVTDPTLSVSGKAADAAKVGEAVNAEAERAKAAEEENAKKVSQLKEDIEDIANSEKGVYTFTPNLVDGYVDTQTGAVSDYAGTESNFYKRTSYLHIPASAKKLVAKTPYDSSSKGHYATALYDADKNVISSTIVVGANAIVSEIPHNAKFFVSSVKNVDDGLAISVLVSQDSANTNKRIDKILAKPDQLISCWGDSTIEGMNMNSAGESVYNGDNMPSQLLTLLKNNGYNISVDNMGHGGERSTEVCARIGSDCFYLAEDITIPADNTAVSLGVSKIENNKITGSKICSTLKNFDETNAQMYLTQINRHTRPLTINGWNFNLWQTTVGDGVDHLIQLTDKFGIDLRIPKYSALTFGSSNRYGINVVHMGINDGANMSLAEWIKRCRRIVEKYPKTLICGLYNGAWTFWKNGTGTESEKYEEYVKSCNDAFGTNWINLYEVFCTFKCIDTAMLGGYLLNRTDDQIKADETAVFNHHTCPSLTLNGTEGEVHFNNIGYYVFAKTIYDKLEFLGWIHK